MPDRISQIGPESPPRPQWPTRYRVGRLATVAAGIVLIQAILYGPSLIGARILLPLEILGLPDVYLHAPENPGMGFDQHIYSDQILAYEMNRRFASAEFREGRIPMWNPHGYTGAPFATFFKYSPFVWPYYLVGSPKTLAWIQLLIALVAGLGAYAFFRISLRASFWASALGAWCLPISGFFLLWQGYSLPQSAAWLPWLLLATEQTARHRRMAAPMLALVTALILVSGQIDVAAQSLIATGIFGAWACARAHRRAGYRNVLAAGAALLSAWLIGALLAAPYLLPLQEYARTGHRVAERASGSEERPPIGVSAIPPMLLPDAYGGSGAKTLYIGDVNQLESPAAAYTGLLLTLLVAPFAFRSRSRRSITLVLSGLLVLALSWSLAIPGFVQLLRLPGLNLLSHNRFVFVSSFCVLALSVIGWSEMLRPGRLSRFGMALGLIAPIGFGIWCVSHAIHLPEPIASALEEAWRRGEPGLPVRDLAHIRAIQESFRESYFRGALLCLVAVVGWIVIGWANRRRAGLIVVVALLSVGELLHHAYGLNPQSDPRLYYPSIPTLERLAEIAEGRVLGVSCLPPNLGERFGFRDVRGYDGVDPARIFDLLNLCVDPEADPSRKTAQWFAPKLYKRGGDLRVHPVLSLLNVRYLIFRGTPPQSITPLLSGDDYWIAENRSVLPRIFIPRRVERVRDGDETLERLAAPEFDPAEVAFVDAEMSSLPALMSGSARIVEENPTRVEVACDLPAPALVVLSDQWDPGWRGRIDGQDVRIHRVDHAIRGVVVPAGRSSLVFTYRPASFRAGVWTAAFAGIGWVFWIGQVLRRSRRNVRRDRGPHDLASDKPASNG